MFEMGVKIQTALTAAVYKKVGDFNENQAIFMYFVN